MSKLTLEDVFRLGRERIAREHAAYLERGGEETARAEAELMRRGRVLLGEEDEEGNCLLPVEEDEDEAEDEEDEW